MRERTATQKKNLSLNRSRSVAGTDSILKTITYTRSFYSTPAPT
jgi:hypothetical protein